MTKKLSTIYAEAADLLESRDIIWHQGSGWNCGLSSHLCLEGAVQRAAGVVIPTTDQPDERLCALQAWHDHPAFTALAVSLRTPCPYTYNDAPERTLSDVVDKLREVSADMTASGR
jgi:hypothetical protein